MKTSTFIASILIGFILVSCSTSKSNQRNDFSINIRTDVGQVPALWKEFSVTQDSVLVNTREFDKTASYAIMLPEEKRLRLLHMLSNNKWKQLDSSYMNDQVADGAGFIFNIHFRKQAKKIIVHHTQVEELSALTKTLDSILPVQYKIGY